MNYIGGVHFMTQPCVSELWVSGGNARPIRIVPVSTTAPSFEVR